MKTCGGKTLKISNHKISIFKGKLITKQISINYEDDEYVRTKLRELIMHNPIDAFFAGVSLNKDKSPNEIDLEKASKLHTVIELT